MLGCGLGVAVSRFFELSLPLLFIPDTLAPFCGLPSPLTTHPVPEQEEPAAAGASDGGAAPAAPAEGAAAAPANTRLHAQLALIDAEAPAAPDEGDSDALTSLLGRLDLVLTWLWRVHGVDYYGGRWVIMAACVLVHALHACAVCKCIVVCFSCCSWPCECHLPPVC